MKILHTLIGMGSAPLAAAGPYPAGDKEILKNSNMSNTKVEYHFALLKTELQKHEYRCFN